MSSRLKVVLGCGAFAERKLTQDKPCHDILNVFLNRGYKDVDAALAYGEGKVHEILARFVAISPQASFMSVHTKINPWRGNSLTREGVLTQAATSLAGLQTSCVDIFYLHAPDHNTPVEETLAAVQQLYEEGKFKEFGLSNYASWEVADIYHICKHNGWVLPTVYQGMYNAITRMVEGELFPALRHFGLRFYAYNPLACGILSGKYTYSDLVEPEGEKKEGRFFNERWGHLYRNRYFRESVLKGVELVKKALDEVYGTDQVSMVSASIRWLNHHSKLKPELNDGLIIGGSCMEHIVANINACEEGPLDQRVVEAFDKAWDIDKSNCVPYYR